MCLLLFQLLLFSMLLIFKRCHYLQSQHQLQHASTVLCCVDISVPSQSQRTCMHHRSLLSRSRTHSFRHHINSIRHTMQTSIIIYITLCTYIYSIYFPRSSHTLPKHCKSYCNAVHFIGSVLHMKRVSSLKND